MLPRTTKTLAVPSRGKRPTFEEITIIVLTGTLYDLSVCVLCLNSDTLAQWMNWLEKSPRPVTLLDVLNTNQATLADWRRFLQSHAYDLTILAGVESELRARRLSVGYTLSPW